MSAFVSVHILGQLEHLETEKIVRESPKDKDLIQKAIDKLMNQYGITDSIKIEKTREEIIREREKEGMDDDALLATIGGDI